MKKELLNKQGNEINIFNVKYDDIINFNNKEFDTFKNYILKSIQDIFYLYSKSSLKNGTIHVGSWINEKKQYVLKLEEVYIIVYNDMFNRSSLYDCSDIINYQIMFNKSINDAKKILNGLKVKGV